MAIRVAIQHHTAYFYDKHIQLFPQVIRLRPAVHSRTPILAYSLKIKPENHFINWQQDPFGNYLARVVFPDKVKEFVIDVEVIAEMVVINPFDFFLEEYAEKFPFTYNEQLKKELIPYLEIKESGDLLQEFLKTLEQYKDVRTVDFLVAVNQAVNRAVNYNIRLEPGIQTCEETLGKAFGSCRDSGWLLVQILRHFGLAARFVSGYLVQLKADQKALDGPSGPEQDFTDLHAWAEVYVPGAGWIGLDPTSGLFAGEGHIPLACTPDAVSAAAISGFLEPTETKFEYSNQVSRIHEDPRVSKPYTDAQWQAMVDLGFQIENDLQREDVRLTMGGEPTFVSVDDMEAEEWNVSADGAHKRVLGDKLVKQLKEIFGKGGFIHYGQGKWYPGEPLPRWQYSLNWRKDGLPLWQNPDLLADIHKNYGFDHSHAEAFILEVANYLNVNPKNVCPAYEDVFYQLWEEENLPTNIDPLKVNLKDTMERRTMSEKLRMGLNNPTGFALPLQWNHFDQRWLSCAWEFKRQYMFLVPGNSPMGLRLPLKSLPYEVPKQRYVPFERSPFEEVGKLADYHTIVKARYGKPVDETIPEELLNPKAYKIEKSAEDIEKEKYKPVQVKEKEEEIDTFEPIFKVFTIKTALCIEARQGRVYVFMPPCEYLEHYLDVLAAIELTAQKLQIPVVIEGYEPPRDYRTEKLVVTPDPGVIEVNIQPAKNWGEILYNFDHLFEAAKASRLGAEKFMLDGRHIGTGGGNHITIGGVKPADSPILRKPDLLRSLVTYWQNHPGLSYLFSTAFIGTTSQAPRVDEGRLEMLYELEIAFSQIPDNEQVPYWLVDRIFRNLLIDITGNTHRAEFCIDKLYRPDTNAGRLGILELRAFDMPPSKQMCLLQLLLIRALIAMFWQKPYQQKLVRWGTELHDKFLLHHYVREDLKEVIEQLNQFGYGFELSWFEPFFEFRFPMLGKVQVGDIQLVLRTAIEPWNVLGEEMSSVGMARFVDSSVERLEVVVSGFTTERYILLCNGVRVPLRPTGVHGEAVAGIRYKAWNPPSALHPTLQVDAPLVFDIFDTWNGRSIGGCTYYVYHPGGRSYDTYPVNSFESESRRESRFWEDGHTQGKYQPPVPTIITTTQSTYLSNTTQKSVVNHENNQELIYVPSETPINPEYPYTVDLRRVKKK
jgi:uncharacterized protein (DUF2126 family)/transglutaminase-like putative cysteine protease